MPYSLVAASIVALSAWLTDRNLQRSSRRPIFEEIRYIHVCVCEHAYVSVHIVCVCVCVCVCECAHGVCDRERERE